MTFTLYGSFAKTYKGHGTDRALLAGIMGMEPDDPNLSSSFELARSAGLRGHPQEDRYVRGFSENPFRLKPFISSGAYGYPKDKAFKTATSVIEEFLLSNEITDLLLRSGFALSHNSKFDIIIQYFIGDGTYSYRCIYIVN